MLNFLFRFRFKKNLFVPIIVTFVKIKAKYQNKMISQNMLQNLFNQIEHEKVLNSKAHFYLIVFPSLGMTK